MASFSRNSPVNCDVEFDTKNIENKTAIVTGGANGLGEAYVRALVAVGQHHKKRRDQPKPHPPATVVIADRDVGAGKKLEEELTRAKFIECDTSSWDDQVRLFEAAASLSPTGKVSFVIANAGIHRKDEVFTYAGDDSALEKPDLATIDVNLVGTLYTSKLASHYFIKQNGQQPSESQEDTCLILIGSGAAFLDCPRAPQYCATKWAMRGIMHSLRRTAFYYRSRVNVISPWYVKTNILSEDVFAHVKSIGIQLAEASEAGECLLRILSDSTINSRSFFVSGKKWSTRGYLDLDIDDYLGDSLIEDIQQDQIKPAPVEMGLFV